MTYADPYGRPFFITSYTQYVQHQDPYWPTEENLRSTFDPHRNAPGTQPPLRPAPQQARPSTSVTLAAWTEPRPYVATMSPFEQMMNDIESQLAGGKVKTEI